MITAGKFLEHFVKAPYIHMDIAGPAFLETSTKITVEQEEQELEFVY
jgi:leucyl aminopeptidase